MQRIEIDSTKSLKPGDRIELHYTLSGPDWAWYKATLIAMIESRAMGHENFVIKSSRFDGDKFILTIDIIQPPQKVAEVQEAGIVTTASIIAAAAVVIGGISWLLLDKVYQLTDSPGGQVAVAGVGLGVGAIGIAALAFVLIMLFRGVKG